MGSVLRKLPHPNVARARYPPKRRQAGLGGFGRPSAHVRMPTRTIHYTLVMRLSTSRQIFASSDFHSGSERPSSGFAGSHAA
jgi:hypothetical protein